eukprot:scaffold324_cov394-Prasinococcus_capsulatus_cf.AAC.13
MPKRMGRITFCSTNNPPYTTPNFASWNSAGKETLEPTVVRRTCPSTGASGERPVAFITDAVAINTHVIALVPSDAKAFCPLTRRTNNQVSDIADKRGNSVALTHEPCQSWPPTATRPLTLWVETSAGLPPELRPRTPGRRWCLVVHCARAIHCACWGKLVPRSDGEATPTTGTGGSAEAIATQHSRAQPCGHLVGVRATPTSPLARRGPWPASTCCGLGSPAQWRSLTLLRAMVDHLAVGKKNEGCSAGLIQFLAIDSRAL